MDRRGRARTLALGLCIGAIAAGFAGDDAATGGHAESVAPGLDSRALTLARSVGRASVIVSLARQADLTPAHSMLTKEERGRFVVERLREVAAVSQPPLVAWLHSRGAAVEPFWVSNVLVVDADEATLLGLAVRSDVASVTLEPIIHRIDPPPSHSSGSLPASAQLDAVERGLREIGVHDVWRMGFEGEGAVVAVTDTGANDRHPALANTYRGHDSHDYAWLDAVDGEEEPEDDDGHGTHVTGTIVGRHGSRQIGVAPKAEWIACRLIERRSGGGRSSLRCLQWLLAPTRVDGSDPRPDLAPDVVNASWGADPGSGCLSTGLRSPLENLAAAGILVVAAAGNSGDGCKTVCVPAAYPGVLAVGNYDVGTRRMNGSSSRGPVEWPDGEIIKPDISAPGTAINSSVPPAGYGELTGTSMASPHVAGVAALLISAKPEYRGRPELIREALVTTGRQLTPDRCGPGGDREYNNSAGRGLVMADKSVAAALTATAAPSATATATASPTATATATPVASPTPTDTPEPDFYTVYMPNLMAK